MKKIVVYTKDNCPECVKAKHYLDAKHVDYSVVNVNEQPEARQFLVDQGLRSVPQIYVDGTLTVGGYRGLIAQDESFWVDLPTKVA